MSNILEVIILCFILKTNAKTGWASWSDCEGSLADCSRRQFMCANGEDCRSETRGAFEQIANGCNATNCLENVDEMFLASAEVSGANFNNIKIGLYVKVFPR